VKPAPCYFPLRSGFLNLVHHPGSLVSHDARYPEGAEVVYPLHPLCGQRVAVLRIEGSGLASQVLVDTPHGAQFLPGWMIDPCRCRQLVQGDRPCCSLSTLRQLDALLASLDGKTAHRSQHS
jgi:hypothetical protein